MAAAGDGEALARFAASALSGEGWPQGPSRTERLVAIGEEALRLAAWDAAGRFWRLGLLADCQRAADGDARLGFVAALPRSAHFGRVLAEALIRGAGGGEPREEALDLARLINLFITAFDGICDEAPEQLPLVRPALAEMFGRCAPLETLPEVPAPLPALVLAVAQAAFALLLAAAAAVPEARRARVAEAVRTAFAAQMDSLRGGPADRDAVTARRTGLSVATFVATTEAAMLFIAADEDALTALPPLAKAAGAFFGWTDDVVDLPADVARGRANMATGFLAAGEDGGLVIAETLRRWRTVEASAAPLPYPAAVLHPLRAAAVAWLDPSAC